MLLFFCQILLFLRWLNCNFPIVLSNRCRLTEAKTVLKDAMSSSVSPSAAVFLYESQESKREESSSNHCFHWLWSISLPRKWDCFIVVVLLYEDLGRIRDQSCFFDRDAECVFAWLIAQICTSVCLLPRGQPGQPAEWRLFPSAPSAPSCWTPPRPLFLFPLSPAAPSTARWFAPGHREGGGGGVRDRS